MAPKSKVYEVEKILKMRKRGGRSNEYLIHWANFDEDEDSWEPEENLTDCPDILNAFLKANATPRSSRKATPGRKSTTSKSPSRASTRSTSKSSAPAGVTQTTTTSESKTISGATTTTTSSVIHTSYSSSSTPALLKRPGLRSRGRIDFSSGDNSVVQSITRTTTTSSLSSSGAKQAPRRRCDVLLFILLVVIVFVAAALYLQPLEV